MIGWFHFFYSLIYLIPRRFGPIQEPGNSRTMQTTKDKIKIPGIFRKVVTMLFMGFEMLYMVGCFEKGSC